MGIVSGIKNMVVNALDYKRLRKQTQALKSTALGLVTPQKATRKETFEDALERLDLTEEDIQKRTKEFKRLMRFFVFIGLMLLLYFIYAVTQKAVIASLATIGIFLMALGQIFRYHFWLFQIRQRRLGCTFRDWINDLVGKKV